MLAEKNETVELAEQPSNPPGTPSLATPLNKMEIGSEARRQA